MSSTIRIRRICEQCGHAFEARKTTSKTCSDSCAKRAYKARQRMAKVEISDQQTHQVLLKPMEDVKARENLNIADASRLLGVSRWTIWRAIGAGSLNAVKLGRRTLIRRSDIDRLFDRPAGLREQARPELVTLMECYTLKEVQQKYSISAKALYELIRRNQIPKQYKGSSAYVPKTRIDELFK